GANSFGGGVGGDFTITGGRVNLDHDFATGLGTIVISPASAVTLGNSLSSTSLTNPITLNAGAGSIDFSVATGRRLTLGGALAGLAAIALGNSDDAGTIGLVANNLAWSGGAEFLGGGLELGNRFALGTGPLNITGTRSKSVTLQTPAGLTNSDA